MMYVEIKCSNPAFLQEISSKAKTIIKHVAITGDAAVLNCLFNLLCPSVRRSLAKAEHSGIYLGNSSVAFSANNLFIFVVKVSYFNLGEKYCVF